MSSPKPFKFENFSESANRKTSETLFKFNVERKQFISDEFFENKEDKLFSKWIENEGINEKTYKDRLEEYFHKKKIEFDKKIEKYFKEKKEEADNILKEAEQKAEQLLKEKEAEGFEKGYNDGFKKGYEEILEKENYNFTKFKELIENLASKEKNILEQFEGKIAQIIIDLAKKIIKKEIECNSEQIIVNNIRHILNQVIDKNELKIFISPQNYNFIKEHLADFNLEKVTILKSDNLENGDVIIESSFGTYNASISEQLDEFEKILDKNLTS